MTSGQATSRLIARVLAGDGRAATELVGRYLRPAYAVALAVVGRPHEAEDVAQESLVAALEKLETCRHPDQFAGWLMQIVRNRARNLLDQRRIREAELPLPELAPASTHPPGIRTQLIDALESLTPQEREVVLLHDLEGWTHAEIGEATGLSDVNSRQILFQARRKLRALLAGDAPWEDGHG